jgi:hypothetical protein
MEMMIMLMGEILPSLSLGEVFLEYLEKTRGCCCLETIIMEEVEMNLE